MLAYLQASIGQSIPSNQPPNKEIVERKNEGVNKY